jgi:hypothetical protein
MNIFEGLIYPRGAVVFQLPLSPMFEIFNELGGTEVTVSNL